MEDERGKIDKYKLVCSTVSPPPGVRRRRVCSCLRMEMMASGFAPGRFATTAVGVGASLEAA